MFILPQEYWQVKSTPHKGRGIFAVKEIPGGTVIGDYLGQLLPAEQENKTGPTYAMTFNKRAIILPPDTKQIGIHVVNHSCMSNCDTFPYKGHVILFALRKIFAGEELTYPYLIDPPPEGNEAALMHPCRCGSLICHGTMNTTHHIQEKTAQFIEEVDGQDDGSLPVPFGEMLPALAEYPKNIVDHTIYDIYGSPTHEPLQLEDEKMPSTKKIREYIRESGRNLHLKKLHITIIGIMNELLIAKNDE